MRQDPRAGGHTALTPEIDDSRPLPTGGPAPRLYNRIRLAVPWACAALACLVGIPGLGGSASAQDPARTEDAVVDVGPESAHRPVEIGVGGHFALLSGDACRRTLSDVVGCEALAFAGFHLAPRGRLSPSWSLGLRAAASLGGTNGDTRTWWQLGGEGRWHPLGASSRDPWLGVDAGVVAVVDRLAAGELGPAATFSRFAPALGVAIGVDCKVAGFLALGPELRAFVFPFGAASNAFERRPEYATQIGGSLGISTIILVGD